MSIPLAASVAEKSGGIILWLGVLLLAIIVLSLGVWYYRRRWISTADSPSSAPWTFEDICRLRDTGAITDEEYQALRATIVGSFDRGVSKSEPPATRAGTAGSGQQDGLSGPSF